MATIAKIKRANGFVYKAIIKNDGRILKTKTFKRKTDAKTRAQGIEAGRQETYPTASVCGFGMCSNRIGNEKALPPNCLSAIILRAQRMFHVQPESLPKTAEDAAGLSHS